MSRGILRQTDMKFAHGGIRHAVHASCPGGPRVGKRSKCVCHANDLLIDGSSPTDPRAWMQIIRSLHEHDVKLIQPQEVAFCAERNMSLIDVRTPEQYRKGFIKGFVNVPLFQPIKGWSPYKISRRLGYALFGVLKGTEPNVDFVSEIEECVDNREAGIVLCCNLGGTLYPEKTMGVQSRSLIAAYELTKAGYPTIRVLNNGVNGWDRDGRDLLMFED